MNIATSCFDAVTGRRTSSAMQRGGMYTKLTPDATPRIGVLGCPRTKVGEAITRPTGAAAALRSEQERVA